MKPFESDKLHRFIFDNSPVRGEWVHLQHTWQNILVRREYPVAL
jgi:molecular chaperone Hsp33